MTVLYAPMAFVIRAEELPPAGHKDQYKSAATGSVLDDEAVPRMGIGKSEYHFVRPPRLRVSYLGTEWTCWSPELPDYKALGDTPSQSRDEWRRQFHADFQQLYGKRPFGMSREETTRWHQLLGVVDLLDYRDNTPIACRSIGRVEFEHYQYPRAIRWLDGSQDTIDLARAPEELARSRVGQWVEAVVRRHPQTGELVSIDSVQRISTVHPLRTHDQVDAAWSRLRPIDLRSEEDSQEDAEHE